jgi:hypothetical protein
MPGQKPPRPAAGESETLHALLQYQRDSLVRKVARERKLAFGHER